MEIAFANKTADQQRAQIEETARRLVANEVRYCVSALVSTLAAREWDGSDGIDPDDLYRLAEREPDADDYRDAAREAGVFDTPAKPGGGARSLVVERDQFKVWCFVTTDEDGDEDDRGTSDDGTEVGAWRAAFDSLDLDRPQGSEAYEHWLVSDWMADKLAAAGESVARDVAGLTIWARCTTGQMIAADAVIEQIAREVLEA
ncbi:hypothetical protein [Sphingomonas sp. NFR15]|uniref:hypothetical protein n=1 Tax=Sphingomonas sp. NFR15 TaxID=1566282 RepID=UPI00088A007B|nr:hypothetical protein [Sphingomonas sp. NFR15]SDA14779.1 hypothetical protein SAMN03159340_00593 [Sphingomonas sp. NFR15]